MGAQEYVALGVALGLLVAIALVVAIARRGRERRKPLFVALIAVLVVTTVGGGVAWGVAWARAGGESNRPAPVDADLTLFTLGADCSSGATTCDGANALYALRARDGSARWRALLPKGASFDALEIEPILFDNGVIYAYTSDSLIPGGDLESYSLTAWRASDGAQLWTARIQEPRGQALLTWVAGDELAIFDQTQTGSDGLPLWRLLRLRAKDGVILGATTFPANEVPAVVDDNVYVCGHDGAIIDLRLSDGGLVWRSPAATTAVQFGVPLGCNIMVAGGVVYVSVPSAVRASSGAVVGEVLALSAANGRTLWRYVSPSPFLLAVGDGLVVLGDERRYSAPTSLVALRVSDGRVAWRHGGFPPQSSLERGLDPTRTLVIGDGLVLFGGGGYTLWALHADDGRLAWQVSEDGHVFDPLGVVDGAVFVTNYVRSGCYFPFCFPFPVSNVERSGFFFAPDTVVTNYISALRPSDGALYWKSSVQLGGAPIIGEV
jgi:outer membrane protein assembly factor BamB